MKKDGGFIALMSVIVISLVLMLVATTLGFSGFYGRYNVLDSELKEISVRLAEACADAALVKLVGDPDYSPTNEVVVVGEESCTIESVTASGNERTIRIEAEHMNYFTNLVIRVDTTDFSIVSWEEV